MGTKRQSQETVQEPEQQAHDRVFEVNAILDQKEHKEINHVIAAELIGLRHAIYKIVERSEWKLPHKLKKGIRNRTASADKIAQHVPEDGSEASDEVKQLISAVHMCRDELFCRNTGLMFAALEEHRSLVRRVREQNEVWDAAENGLLSATEKWDPENGELSTLAYISIRHELIKVLNAQENPMASLDKSIMHDEDGTLLQLQIDEGAPQQEDELRAQEIQRQITALLSQLPHPTLRRIVELRFGIGTGTAMSWKELVTQLETEGVVTPKKGKGINVEKAKTFLRQALRIMGRRGKK